MLRGLLCVGKVCYPELDTGNLTVLDAIELLLQCSQTYTTQTTRSFAVVVCSALGRFVFPSWRGFRLE